MSRVHTIHSTPPKSKTFVDIENERMKLQRIARMTTEEQINLLTSSTLGDELDRLELPESKKVKKTKEVQIDQKTSEVVSQLYKHASAVEEKFISSLSEIQGEWCPWEKSSTAEHFFPSDGQSRSIANQ